MKVLRGFIFWCFDSTIADKQPCYDVVFAAIRKLDRLKQVYNKLPSDCVGKAMANSETMEQLHESNAIKEYLCFRTYLVRLIILYSHFIKFINSVFFYDFAARTISDFGIFVPQ